MNIFKFNLEKQEEINQAVEKSIKILNKGGTIVHPTDTCYGIAADMKNEMAVKKVYKLKGRDFNNPLFIILLNIIQFKKYGHWNLLIKKMIKKNPNKMFTFVVPRKKIVPEYLNPNFDTIGIQMPKCLFSQALLKKFKSPVIGTSANVFNQPVVYSTEDLLIQLKKVGRYPDLILDVGRIPIKKPSSVIKVEGEKIKILRK